MKGNRSCYVVLETQFDKSGYIPSLVTENEPGHAPMTGRGECSVPWYWGKTFKEAQETCNRANEKNGITPAMAEEIMLSSIKAGMVKKKA